ncbi:MAG: hypothetical protein WDA16_09150 [Candidatus Thermoplasmatota archaeon]
MPRRSARIPPDISRVVEDHRALGQAIRRALYVSERVTRKDVEEAVRRAVALRRGVR